MTACPFCQRTDGAHEPTCLDAPRRDTLADARRDLMERGRWEGVECPCCGRLAKVYAEKFGRSHAIGLLHMHRHSPDEWVHVMSLFKSLRYYNGMHGKYVRWGLTEHRTGEPNEFDETNPSNGYYRLTDLGRAFCRNKATIARECVSYNDTVLRMGGPMITIVDALGDPFVYEELMRPVEATP